MRLNNENTYIPMDFFEYSSTFSHDVLNHMTVLYGGLQLVEGKIPDITDLPDWKHLRESMCDLTDYLNTTSEYRYSFNCNKEKVNILEILWNIPDYIDDLYDSLGKECNRNYSFDFPADLPIINGDFSRIMKALIAIVRNAIEATSDDDEILISAKANSQYIEVTIEDHGTGIASDINATLGMPFKTTKSGHAGVGIATAVNTAINHGGYVDITSSDSGTCVTFAIAL